MSKMSKLDMFLKSVFMILIILPSLFRKRDGDVCQVLPDAQVLRPDPDLGQTGCVRHAVVGQEGVLRVGVQRRPRRAVVGFRAAAVCWHVDHHRLHSHLGEVLQGAKGRNGGARGTEIGHLEG